MQQLTLLAHAVRLVRAPRGVGSHPVARYDAPQLQTCLSRTAPSSPPMDPSTDHLARPGGAMGKPWTLCSASPDPSPRHGRLGGPGGARLPRALRDGQHRAWRRHPHLRPQRQLPCASDRPSWPSRSPGTCEQSQTAHGEYACPWAQCGRSLPAIFAHEHTRRQQGRRRCSPARASKCQHTQLVTC